MVCYDLQKNQDYTEKQKWPNCLSVKLATTFQVVSGPHPEMRSTWSQVRLKKSQCKSLIIQHIQHNVP